MGKSNKGVVLVVILGAAAGLAVVLWYMLVWIPRQETRAVRKEIATWGRAWQKARACLTGDPPASSDGYQAIVLRPIYEPYAQEKFASCTDRLRNLQRPKGTAVGSDAVEQQWPVLIKMVGNLAAAQAWTGARRQVEGPARLRERLANAVADVDAAYAGLRDKAGMKAPTYPGPVPLPEIKPGAALAITAPGGKSIAHPDVQVRAGRVIVTGAAGKRHAEAIATGPRSVRAELFAAGVVPAAAGAGWAVTWQPPNDVAAGALTAAGNVAGLHTVAPAPKGATIQAGFAWGSAQDRAVLYRITSGRAKVRDFLVRSGDGGDSWGAPAPITRWVPAAKGGVTLYRGRAGYDYALWSRARPDAPVVVALMDPAAGRLDLTWLQGHRLMWLPLDQQALAGPLAPSVLLEAAPGRDARVLCAAPGRLWWWIDGQLYESKPEGPGPAHALAMGTEIELDGEVRCTGDRLLAIRTGPEVPQVPPRLPDRHVPGRDLGLVVCDPHACAAETPLPRPARGAPLLALGPKIGPVVGVQENRILVLYTGDPAKGRKLAPHPAALLPRGWNAVDLVVWGGKPFAVALDDAGHVRIISVPLP